MTDRDDALRVQHPHDGGRMSSVPLLFAGVVYASVAISLYLETGRPHVGTSYPVAFAIVALLVGFFVDRRWIDD